MNIASSSKAQRQTPWHLVQVSDVLDIEFGSALAEQVPLMAWEPVRTYFPWSPGEGPARLIKDPPLEVRPFPLVRGYSRFPISALARTGSMVTEHLARHTPDPATSPLICTTPYLAPVAERWPGPVIYWLTDRMEKYAGANEAAVHRLDERMCQSATLVCPNSTRIADYLAEFGACPRSKIRIIPNATRERNLLAAPEANPGPLPADLADLRRPIAGVIGNLAGNMDWIFIEQVLKLVPNMHWAFVGPTTMRVEDPIYGAARDRVMRSSRVRFVGRKPYGELAAYARAFDVAVLPYRKCEPTYSGSSTRFYEHLAACRPMVATRGFAELLQKEPLLRTVASPEEAAIVIGGLSRTNFDDNLAELRWEESLRATWQTRATTMREALQQVTEMRVALAS